MIYLRLDTTPPRIGVEGDQQVSYPDDMLVEVTSSKAIAFRHYEVMDAAGQIFRLGYRPVGMTMDHVLIPSVRMARGMAMFHAIVGDVVGNETEEVDEFHVESPIPFSVRAEQDEVFGLVIGSTPTLQTVMMTKAAYKVSIYYDAVFDVDSLVESALDVKTYQTEEA